MYVITITKWKRKLVALIVAIAVVITLGWGISKLVGSEESTVSAPADSELQDDVLSQPIKTQAPPANPGDEQAEPEPSAEEQAKP